ncbi:hypothetical protein ACFTSF_33865 [Kribbella sp. NPDC056951]|uniref:hypothetical protein n=1 Tax=Kribbella sp. NPDC056951 TaxID=3345978 RepID=UPI00362691FE
MRTYKRAAAVAASVVLLGSAAVAAGGTAAVAAPAAACTGSLYSIDGAGDWKVTDVSGTKPPTSASGQAQHLFPAGAAKIASRWNWGPDVAGSSYSGYVVLGSTLNQSVYSYSEETGQWEHNLTKIADGWDKFTMVEESFVSSTRNARYGLRNDGVLFRWTSGWNTVASAPGFAGVKAMTLISQTASYDTFLATTKAGALQTIRIPTTAPLKPVVKTVRGSTWQGFETLVADKCGTGTLLTAIDRDTNSAYVYSIGHATGTTTPITNLGKLSTSFADPVYSRFSTDDDLPLAGE